MMTWPLRVVHHCNNAVASKSDMGCCALTVIECQRRDSLIIHDDEPGRMEPYLLFLSIPLLETA